MDVNITDGGVIVENTSFLLSGKEYEIVVKLQLKKKVPQRVYAPRFKKPKSYSYFVVVMDGDERILVGNGSIEKSE